MPATNKRTKTSAPLAIRALWAVEWSGHEQGQGYGPMGSGGNGPLVRCCPGCRGIDPSDPRRYEFAESAHGHRPRCLVAKALAE